MVSMEDILACEQTQKDDTISSMQFKPIQPDNKVSVFHGMV